MSFFQELKRRNVVRVGIAYAVATWLLIQVTDIVFPRIGLPDSAVTLVIALLAIGFVPALILAWAFEMTPEGLKREKDVDRANSITPNTAKKLDRVIIGIMAVIIAFLVFDRFNGQGSEPAMSDAVTTQEEAPVVGTRNPSIAVLPFINMSNDADNEYFSDGISEELLNVLVKVSALKVASRTSAFAYKGKDTPIPQIARELDVDHVLEGSVRKAGNRVRITAQLIDTESDRHLWSETYERELDDIFEIQEEISNAIVDALKIALNVDEVAAVSRAQRPTENAEAYELYLQGRHAWRLRHEENIRLSIDLFEQAVALDPEFARAYEGLASSWGILDSWSDDVSAADSIQKAAGYARQALELDPTLAEARSQLAEEAASRHQWQAAIDQYQIALKNEPRNPTPLQWYAELLQGLGYHQQALDTMLKAYAMDPASPVINHSLVWIAVTAGDDKTARRHAEIGHRLGVGDRAERNLFYVYMRAGQREPMLKILQDEDAPPFAYACMEALQDPSLQAELANKLRQFTDQLEAAIHDGFYIECMAYAGEAELAASWLTNEEAWQGDALTFFWFDGPGSAATRKTSAFKAFLIDKELPQFYRQHGWPDHCHPVGEEDFACE